MTGWQMIVTAEAERRAEAWERYQRERRVKLLTMVAALACVAIVLGGVL